MSTSFMRAFLLAWGVSTARLRSPGGIGEVTEVMRHDARGLPDEATRARRRAEHAARTNAQAYR
ncbi:MAG: hypothetical protein ACK5VV_02615, partial [Lysobacteraceae bacterium]